VYVYVKEEESRMNFKRPAAITFCTFVPVLFFQTTTEYLFSVGVESMLVDIELKAFLVRGDGRNKRKKDRHRTLSWAEASCNQRLCSCVQLLA